MSDTAYTARSATPPSIEPARLRPRPRLKWKRWAIPAAILLLLIVLAVWAVRKRASAATAALAGKTTVVAVARGNVEKSIDSAGKVIPNLEVDIKCRAGGEIVKLPFDISQSVKKGDLLCQLDPTDENLSVRSAEATVTQSKAKLEQTKANLATAEQNLITTKTKTTAALASATVRAANTNAKANRQKQLVEQSLGSREEAETADTEAAAALSEQRAAEVAVEELKQQEIQLEYKRQDVLVSEAQLSADQINLDSRKKQLDYTTVTAPMDGTVSALNVQQGTIITSGTNAANGGTTLMTLVDLSHVYVMATVDESDIGGVHVGQAARITVDSYAGRAFTGNVVRVAVKGVTASNVVTFEVKVEVVDENKNLLKPEMTGNVTIVEDERKNVLIIPTTAVTRRAGKTTVQLEGGAKRDVVTGLEGVENVEVLEGLAEGDKVLNNTAEPPSKWRTEGGGPPG